jgi:hypothetical protein
MEGGVERLDAVIPLGHRVEGEESLGIGDPILDAFLILGGFAVHRREAVGIGQEGLGTQVDLHP